MNSVLRTKPIEGGPEQAIWSSHFALRKRQDGGYTIASGHENVVPIVPKSFRYALDFLPALKKEWRSLNLRLGYRFLDEARLSNKWALDEPSPFEYNRVLDPKPNQRLSDNALSHVKRHFRHSKRLRSPNAGPDIWTSRPTLCLSFLRWNRFRASSSQPDFRVTALGLDPRQEN